MLDQYLRSIQFQHKWKAHHTASSLVGPQQCRCHSNSTVIYQTLMRHVQVSRVNRNFCNNSIFICIDSNNNVLVCCLKFYKLMLLYFMKESICNGLKGGGMEGLILQHREFEKHCSASCTPTRSPPSWRLTLVSH